MSFTRMPHRGEAGFTLVEMLIVIAIIGVLVAVAIPIFLSQTDKAEAASAQSDTNTAYRMLMTANALGVTVPGELPADDLTEIDQVGSITPTSTLYVFDDGAGGLCVETTSPAGVFSAAGAGVRPEGCESRGFAVPLPGNTSALDTDGDGTPDVLDTDDDNDGFTDVDEQAAGTDPLDANSWPGSDAFTDTDGDGYFDAFETLAGSDPNVYASQPVGAADYDADGFTNQDERAGGSLPDDNSSVPTSDDDSDGVLNQDERAGGSSPYSAGSVPAPGSESALLILNGYLYRSGDAHVFTVTGGTATVNLPTTNATYVDWGDGAVQTNVSNPSHTYADPTGPYTIIAVFDWDNGTRSVSLDWVAAISQVGLRLSGGTTLNGWPTFPAFVTDQRQQLANGRNAFRYLTGNNVLALQDLDTSNLTDMRSMFYYASSFNQDISGWDVSGVTTFSSMFERASTFNQDLSGWNVSSAGSMSSMFRSATLFNNGGQPLTWGETSGLYSTVSMLQSASSFNQPLTLNTSGVTQMQQMFAYASSFNSPLTMDPGSAVYMHSMFDHATSFNQDIGGWDVTSATNMSSMFETASAFNNAGQPMPWNLASATNVGNMFRSASSFNADVSGMNVSNVTGFAGMFQFASSFNQDISGWDVSSGTNFTGMFRYQTAFDQDLSGWNVANATMWSDFAGSTSASWTAAEKPVWPV